MKMGGVHADDDAPGYYYFNSVPIPNPAFDLYSVKASPKQGVCRVSGLGITIKSDPDGSKTRAAFFALENTLNAKYGKSKRFDFLHVGAIYSAPSQWLQAIKEKQRDLTTYWDKDEKSTIPNDVASIILDTRALSSTEGYIAISYEFTNKPACDEEIKNQPSTPSQNKAPGDGL